MSSGRLPWMAIAMVTAGVGVTGCVPALPETSAPPSANPVSAPVSPGVIGQPSEQTTQRTSSGTPVSPAQIAATRIEQCETQHHLASQNTKTARSDSVTVFDSCDWPAPSSADSDGFTEQSADGPGQGEASDANVVDRITGPCQTFRLSYDFGAQGALEHLAPFDAPSGLITSLDNPGRPWQPGVSALDFYPDRTEVDVVHNDNNALVNATCRN